MRRTAIGRARASMQLRTVQAIAISVCWALNDRTQNRL
jgi:hypothetical protein